MILKQRKIIIGIAAALLALVVIMMIGVLTKSKKPANNKIAGDTERKTEQVSHESEQAPAITP
jgi:ABC-type Na+ efflux pump permease subunit